MQGWARRLGYDEASAGSLEFEREYLARVQATSPAEVRAAAAQALTPEGVSLAGLLPKDFPLSEDQAREILAAELRPAPSRKVEPNAAAPAPAYVRPPTSRPDPLKTYKLPGGGTLLVERDPSVPLAAFRAAYPGGLFWESEAQNGIGQLLAMTLTRGATGRSSEAIALEVDRMAGSLGGAAGRNSFGLSGEFLSRFFPDAFGLFLDCLLHPELAEAELEKERALLLQAIRSRDDHPSGLAFELFAKTLYRTHPYRLPLHGAAASVEKISRADLERFLGKVAGHGALTLAVVGDVDPERVMAQASEAILAAPQRRETAHPPKAGPEAQPREPRRIAHALDKAQSHLVLGYLGARLADADRFALDVLSAVLSGQGGRLFVELRDKRSMASSVSSMRGEGLDPGYFAVYMGTSPEKVDAALAGVREELRRVREDGVSEPELARSRQHLIGTHAISLQRRAASAGALALDHAYGLGAEEHRRYPERIAAVTAGHVRAVAQKYLDPKGEVLALVGPKGKSA